MRIAITGSSGLIGKALAASLESDGHEVIRVVRSGSGAGAIKWDPAAGSIDAAAFEGLDGVVHLAGEPIASHRWTAEQKRKILESRTVGTRLLADALAACTDKPPVMVSGSGIDFYGDRGDEELTEASGPGEGFLTDVVLAWEAAAAPAEAAGIRVPRIRTAMVLDASDGALAKMLLPFKLGIGGRFGSGRQWMSWISLDDHVRAVRFLLEHDLGGPVNLAAPGAVTNAAFTKALGAVLHRPTSLPTPLLAPKLMFGSELVETLLLASHRIVPKALLDAGFEFWHPDIGTALRAVLSNAEQRL
jgi:uncharacterized protein (TIGR01777 family)